MSDKRWTIDRLVWERVERYSVHGLFGIDIEKTIDKFKDHLAYGLYLLRRDGRVDYFELEKQMGEFAQDIEHMLGGYGGWLGLLEEPKKVKELIKQFELYITNNIQEKAEEEKKKRQLGAARRKNILKCFEEFNNEVLPESKIILSVCILQQVSLAQQDTEAEAIRAEMDLMLKDQIMAHKYEPLPAGYFISLDTHGKETREMTAFSKDKKVKIDYERPRRGAKQGQTRS